MKILISGAGVGGLALAGYLKDEPNVECVVIDKVKAWHQDGFSIAVWENGRLMLSKLGLGGAFDRAALPFKRLCIKNGDGSVVRDFGLSNFDVEFGMSVAHVPRHSLHEWLVEASGAQIKLDTTIKELKEENDGVDVVFSNGEKEKFDLVVGADGIHSQVRALTAGIKEHYVNWRAWWFWCSSNLCEPHTINEYVLPGKFAVLSNEGDRTLAVFMAHAAHGIWDEENGRVDRMKKLFEDATAISPAIFEGKKDAEVMPSDLTDLKLPYWHTKRTVLLGDAAHALTPFVAIGASMALEDAYILAGELAKLPENVERALENYENRRVPRVEKVRELTARMRMITAVDSSFMRKVINLALPLVPKGAAMHDYVELMRKQP